MSFFRAIWRGNSKHKKLYDERISTGDFDCEPMTEASSPEEEVIFRAKYLGSTLVEKPSSEEATAEAIKTILSMAKAGGRKLQRVAISVGLNGIRVVDVPTEETHLDVSIYSISYCSADAAHSQVFAFIATNANETLECHAFLCRKRKTAQVMSLTLARLFRTAYDLLAGGFHEGKFIVADDIKPENDTENNVLHVESGFGQPETTLLIDLDSNLTGNRLGIWECFDDDSSNSFNFDRSWEEKENSEMAAEFGADQFRNLLVNSRWENSRTNLLCS